MKKQRGKNSKIQDSRDGGSQLAVDMKAHSGPINGCRAYLRPHKSSKYLCTPDPQVHTSERRRQETLKAFVSSHGHVNAICYSHEADRNMENEFLRKRACHASRKCKCEQLARYIAAEKRLSDPV